MAVAAKTPTATRAKVSSAAKAAEPELLTWKIEITSPDGKTRTHTLLDEDVRTSSVGFGFAPHNKAAYLTALGMSANAEDA